MQLTFPNVIHVKANSYYIKISVFVVKEDLIRMVSVSHAKLNIVEIVLNHQIFVKSVTKILYLLKLNVFVKKDIPYMKENVPLVRFLIVCIAQHQLI